MIRAVAAITTFLALVSTSGAEAAQRARLTTFDSCASLLQYSRFHALETMGYERMNEVAPAPAASGGAPQSDSMATSAPTAQSAPAAPAPASAREAAPAFSDTNVQEAGVDEPDVVKTDGRRMFAIAQNKLYALAVSGEGAPRVLGSLALPQPGDHQLFLRGDRILVLTGGYAYGPGPIVDRPMPMPAPPPRNGAPARAASSVSPVPGYGQTTLSLIDVTDPAAMRVSRTLTAEGRYVDARMTGTTARVVIDAMPRALQERTPEAIAAARTTRWLPRGVLQRGRKGRKTYMRLAQCDDVRRPPEFSGLDALTVLTIDVSRGLTPVDSDAVLTGADTVYASKNSLYLASQQWNRYSRTLLHKLDIAKEDTTTYRASGEVDGSLLNQFSLSEHDGVLRAATTGDNGETSESFVTTLGERDGRLVQLGKVGGLGRGERIYSVRFIGDQGYVVTFRQVDPLYTLDLKDPAAPRVVGELKILGYSAYLHPMGDNLLIGVGQDATEEGRALGTQVSLFDVSDPRNPVRLQQRRLGERWSTSEAEYDHHAFLWWPQSSLAVLPVHLNNGSFTGAIGVRIRREGIEEVGRIQHPGEYASAIRRAVVVGDRLFTLSPFGVRASTLETLADLDWLPFS